MDIGKEKRTRGMGWKVERSPLSSRGVSQQNGLCPGHGFRLSLGKATFEPHVCLLKIPFSLSSSRNRHLFFPCRP